MDNKEILDILDNINIDEAEFDNIDIELNDLEKSRIKKKYRKMLKSNKWIVKKIVVAAGLMLIIGIGTTMVTPVMASNIPVLGRVYEMLGIYDEYIDYTKYVGQSIQVDGGTYTVEEFMATPFEAVIAIRITGNEPIADKNIGFMASAVIGGAHWRSGESRQYVIDDYNVVQVIKYDFTNKIPRNSNVKINIHETTVDESKVVFGQGEFDFKVSFNKSYDEFTSLDVSNASIDKYGIKVKEVNSSILGTKVVSEINIKGVSEKDYKEKYDKLQYVLNVDGNLYGGFTSSGFEERNGRVKGDTMVNMEGIKFNEFSNAESIKLMIFDSKYSWEEAFNISESDKAISDLANSNYDESNSITEKGVTYSKYYNHSNGSQGEFYGVEREGQTVKMSYKGNESDIVPLSTMRVDSKENLGKMYDAKISKNTENEYIIEIVNVPEDEELVVSFFADAINEYNLIEEIKIK